MNARQILNAAAIVAARACTMDEGEAGELVTLAEEPGLLLEPGEPPPILDPVDLAAARLICSEIEAQYIRASVPKGLV